MDIQCPLIVIGAGRSGSTLLARLFHRHPAVDFRGETSFLLPRLWAESWGDRFWFQWAHDFESHTRRSACDPMPPIPLDLLTRTRTHAARCLAEYIVSLLQIDRGCACWGFKEIWNGSRDHRYDWSAYDAVFPGAWWVHQVRHPFEVARSCAHWNEVPLTREHLEQRLADWCDMVRFNRTRAATGRYFEIRHEDVVSEPAGTLTPILRSVGLDWHDACAAALGEQPMQSRPPIMRVACTEELDHQATANLVASVPDLALFMAELRYPVPASVRLDPAPRGDSRPPFNLRIPAGEVPASPPPRHVSDEELRQTKRKIDDLIQICQALQSQIGLRSWLRRRLG
jgi:hypothetical protein